MSVAARIIESDVRRIWGAVRFVDAASARAIDGPLELRAPGARWRRNNAQLHVLMQLDEPAARRQLTEAIDRLPLTTIIVTVTHDLDDSLPLGRRVIDLDQGRIVGDRELSA